MKITEVRPVLAGGRYLFVEVLTDKGICGWGECGAWGFQRATVEALKQFGSLIEGLDPFRIEHIWNLLTRTMHFRGSVVQAAVSGIDIALWDLKGKAFGVPCYELLGGKVRDKIRIYINASGKTDDEAAANALALKEKGFDAIRFTMPHAKDADGRSYEPFSAVVERLERRMASVRNAVGMDIDVAIEVHRGMKPAEAIDAGKALAKYRPYFYEDPIPDNLDAMQHVIEECEIPVATGERFISIREFDELLSRTGVRYVRPDMCLAGGLTAGKKIAAIAESKGVYLIPHNPLGPISTAVCVQLNACIPNFEIQEYPMVNDTCRLDSEMKEPFEIEKGFLKVPDGPGLGVSLIDDIGSVFPYKGNYGRLSLHEDGSVVDR